MTPILEQDRLDVKAKSRSNLFNWRGQFTPEFIEYLLEKLSPRVGVLDPFCGSGTVLAECARRGVPAFGCEINPAAYAMSKFFTLCNTSIEERRRYLNRLTEYLREPLEDCGNLPLFKRGQEFRERYQSLFDFAQRLLGSIDDKRLTLLALLILFHVEDSGKGNLGLAFADSLQVVKRNLLLLPVTKASVQAHLHDARLCDGVIPSKVDLILTSPPYINVFNYHQNYRAVIEVLGFDMLRVAQSEVGSNRKNRGNRFRTVIQYCLDMELALAGFVRSLSPNGKLLMVVGRESRVRRVPFYNSQIIKELLQCVGAFEIAAFYERTFTNRFGTEIKEDILVCAKTRDEASTGNAVEVARSHLQHALAFAERDVRNDIGEAITYSAQIRPSPLFHVKEVL